MNRRVVLHAGWPRSGSSSLQAGLRGFPNIAGKPWTADVRTAMAQSCLQHLCYGPRLVGPMIDTFLAASQRDPDQAVVLSDERLIGSTVSHELLGHVGIREVVERLTESSWDIRPLLVLRDPKALLRSSYAYEVRHGSTGTYAGFLARVDEQRSRGIGPLAVEQVVEAYADAFGDDSLVVMRLEGLRDHERWWGQVEDGLGVGGLRCAWQRSGAASQARNASVLGPPALDRTVNRTFTTTTSRRQGRHRWFAPPRGSYNALVRRLPVQRFAEAHFNASTLEQSVGEALGAEIDAAVARYGPASDRGNGQPGGRASTEEPAGDGLLD